MSVSITQADFSTIEPCSAIGLLGKRRTGKTTWAKYIMQWMSKHSGRFVAICGNKDSAAEWRTVIHPLFVVQKDIEYLRGLRDYQDKKVALFNGKQMQLPVKYRLVIVIDDCGFDKSFMHSPIMKDVLSNGRHYGISIVILCQYLNQMHSENRDQLDYLGMLFTANEKNVKKVHQEYVHSCPLRTFKYILAATTSERGLCWIDNTKCPKLVQECVFFSRLTWPITVLPFGDKLVRELADRHFMDNTNETKKQISRNDVGEGWNSDDGMAVHGENTVFRDGQGEFHVSTTTVPQKFKND